MSVAIVIAAVLLVLVGMLFGFNIQVNNSLLSTISSLSSVLAAISAAAAAYFSFASIGQWKKQVEHSLLYEQLDELEDLLIQFLEDVKKKAFDTDYKGVTKVVSLPASSASKIRARYERLFNKIADLISEEKLPSLTPIDLNSLVNALFEPICELKSCDYRIDTFIEENEDTKIKPMQEFPEMMEEMRKHMAYQVAIVVICDDAMASIRELRKSL